MKKALITGVNSLVNKALLEKLVERGYKVTAHYHSDNSITHDLKEKYKTVTFIQADFANEESFNNFYKAITSEAPFEVLVNGAVAYKESGDDWQKQQKTWKTWTDSFSVNTTAPALLMANADTLVFKGGVIINISSAMGQTQFGDKQFNMYGASKAALNLITSTFAKRWSPDVRVVGIAPGYVKSAWNVDMNDKSLKTLLNDHLTQRLVEPKEIADLMESVIKNPSINATTILIDGGYSSPIIG